MSYLKRAFIGIVAGFAVLMGVLFLRSAQVSSRQIQAPEVAPIELDAEGIAARLSESIRFRTVSHEDRSKLDPAAFRGFREFLARSYPRLHGAAKRELIAEHSLLYTWKGSGGEAPIVLLAHQDVVPVEDPQKWSQPAFTGLRKGGFVWGRGTLDDKGSLLAILEAAEALLAEGFAPKRDIYLAFGHDEETDGFGAAAIAKTLEQRGVKAALVLDEGGLIAKGLVPQVEPPVALIGLAHKGFLSLELSAEAKGGHSSMPPPLTAAGRVARAVTRLEDRPFPMRFTPGVEHQLDWLAAEVPFGMRVVLSNRWLFGGVVKGIYAKKPSTAATLRTTTAPTMLSGGPKDNVLPKRATAVVNFRILTGESIASVTAAVIETIDDEAVKVRALGTPSEPSPVASPDGPGFQLVQKAVAATFPETISLPFMTVGMMDARHYTGISEQVLRFLPAPLGSEDLPRLHGVDERIAEADHLRSVRFYAALLRLAQ